jgi:hypothetical protein
MGFKQIDLVPLSAVGPTATTPFAKDVVAKAFVVNRTDTVGTLKAVLPADATIVDFVIYGAASNAGTSAGLFIGNTAAAFEYVNGVDVKAAGGCYRPTTMVNPAKVPNLENTPAGADLPIYAMYNETGAVSTAGGPYTVILFYVR